ncbi:uncharacterized protein LOC115751390 isoform X1 [Rhodamnia argentea]|uniref:Uncharacterized protein LOC115751390 isoform X1 n=1 Tax=Rhodamnia argentea TaxID=178133 RepID=A0A8B8QG00_9MYRT|nr:uncharacterized protein LOC115751390 isoform X1 [Rhodamnia argentea]
MGLTCMEVDTDRETRLERRRKRRCLRDPIVMHTSLQNGAPESAPRRTDRVNFVEDEDDDYVNFLRSSHNDYGFVPLEAYRCGGSSGSDDLVDPQYKIFLESLRVTGMSYELVVQVNAGTTILLKYDIKDQPHEGLTLEDLKSRPLKNNAETVRSLRNTVGRERDKVATPRRKENDEEKRIPRNVSGREKESLQTTKAKAAATTAATSKGNCNLDNRNIEAQPANIGSNREIRRSPRVLRPEVPQAPEHEEEMCDESFLAILNGAKDDGNILKFTSGNGNLTTKAAATSKGNCNLDKRKIGARPTNLGSNRAIRQSPRVLRPEVRQAPEHEEETCSDSYLALPNGLNKDGNILAFTSDNGKQTTKAVATSKRNCNLDKRNIEAQPTNLGSTQAIRRSARVLDPEVRQASEHEETWDESYLAFLHCAKEDGSILEFRYDDGKQIRYEEDDEEDEEESSCEVEVLAGEDISKCEEFVTMKLSKDPITIDSKHFADDPGRSGGTVFRKKLMAVLKMPYDVKEHEDLYRRVKHKRQKTVEKSLRQGRDFTSSLGEHCKSYFELYKDLAKELKLVQRDGHRSLNLLRGFFFWLENIPKEGAFKPWLDPTCLEVLPARANRRV